MKRADATAETALPSESYYPREFLFSRRYGMNSNSRSEGTPKTIKAGKHVAADEAGESMFIMVGAWHMYSSTPSTETDSVGELALNILW